MELQANEGFVFPADVRVDDLLAEIYDVSHRLCSCAAVARSTRMPSPTRTIVSVPSRPSLLSCDRRFLSPSRAVMIRGSTRGELKRRRVTSMFPELVRTRTFLRAEPERLLSVYPQWFVIDAVVLVRLFTECVRTDQLGLMVRSQEIHQPAMFSAL